MTTVVDKYLLDRVSRERRFDDRTMEIARRLFLDREKPRKLALEYAVIHQRIYAMRRSVESSKSGVRKATTLASLAGNAIGIASLPAFAMHALRPRPWDCS